MSMALGPRVRSLAGADTFAKLERGKDRLGRITKMGDRYLRKLLVIGATSLIRRARHKPDTADPRLLALLARKLARVASVAMARTRWPGWSGQSWPTARPTRPAMPRIWQPKLRGMRR
jgi:hypothetical protein